MIVATRNAPNDLFDKVNWYVVDDLQEKMLKLQQAENHKDLNRVDLKSKQLNQKYKQAAKE